MRKIRNIADLKQEQRLVERQRIALERELQHDWADIRLSVTDAGSSLFAEAKHQYVSKLLNKGLAFGAGIVARKFGGKIGKVISSWF